MDLSGKVCLVTGASRGLGKGIAVQLASHGAKCYVTGRDMESLLKLNEEVGDSGKGTCVPIRCNHENDNEVKDVFRRIAEENNGQLDLLYLLDNLTNFWEQPEETWDTMNNVGLRNHYLCSVHAAKMMVKWGKGLIINLSSVGGVRYLFSAPYGIGKAAKDRMARDCSIELRKHNVAFVSLWPSLVKTETIAEKINEGMFVDALGPYASKAETPTYVGRVVAALLSEPHKDIMLKSGKTLLTTDIGRAHHITDINGLAPPAMLQLNLLLYSFGYHRLSNFIPDFIRIPFWIFKLSEMYQTC